MFQLLAGAFMGFGMFVQGLFGGHGTASSTDDMHRIASSTDRGGHMATSTDGHRGPGMMGSTTPDGRMMMPHGVAGKVTAVSGTTITLFGKASFEQTATSTYNIDASSAKVMKDGVTSATIANVVVGDTIVVDGTLTGTNVVAKVILDGKLANHPTLQNVVDHLRDGHMGTSTGPMRPHVQPAN